MKFSNLKYLFTSLAVILLLTVSSCYYDNKEDLYQFVEGDCIFTEVSYERDILPILVLNCGGCHLSGNTQGGIDMEGYNKLEAFAANGSLYGSCNHEAGFSAMPPSGDKISDCDLALLSSWIENGYPNN